MTARKPLVLVSGLIQQIQAGDVLDADVNEVDVISAVNEEVSDAITLGMVVYVSSAGKVKKAKADAAATAKGFALAYQASVPSGDTGLFQTSGQLEMADWTSVIGSASLTPNAYYYISKDTAGLLTATAPSTTSQYVTCIGIALSATMMNIKPERPILL